jgi:hypothetical protein
MTEPASYTVDEFAKAERLSRSMLYKLWRQGQGPSCRCDVPKEEARRGNETGLRGVLSNRDKTRGRWDAAQRSTKFVRALFRAFSFGETGCRNGEMNIGGVTTAGTSIGPSEKLRAIVVAIAGALRHTVESASKPVQRDGGKGV